MKRAKLWRDRLISCTLGSPIDSSSFVRTQEHRGDDARSIARRTQPPRRGRSA